LPAEIFSFELELAIAQTGLRLTIAKGKKQRENLLEKITREDVAAFG
jgi:hypothetical protein